MLRQDVWDNLSDHFNTYKAQPDRGVLANVEQTWSNLVLVLQKLPPNGKVLDFGCGTGGLCNRLHTLGFQVAGTDISPRMIDVARAHSPESIDYWVSDGKVRRPSDHYHLITALMVFQFIEDLQDVLCVLSDSLSSDGMLWFTAHNPSYVFHPANAHTRFEDLQPHVIPKKATIVLSGQRIQTFVRDADEYERQCSAAGLEKLHQWYSEPFADGTPSKYLVMTFRRKGR